MGSHSPRLQKTLHPMLAVLVLGLVHCFWHAPLFFTNAWDTAPSDPGQLVACFVFVVSLSYIASWLTNGSRGSLLPAILGHNGAN